MAIVSRLSFWESIVKKIEIKLSQDNMLVTLEN